MSQVGSVEAVEAAYQDARNAVAHYRLPEARHHLATARSLLRDLEGPLCFELELRIRLTESWLTCDDLGLGAALDQVSSARLEAEEAGRDDLRSLAHIQAGVLNARTGHVREALAELRAAVRVSGSLPVEDKVRLLINKGAIGSQAGELAEAAADLRSAAVMAGKHPHYAFMATHNLGFVEYLRGDLPEALRWMAEADALEADVDRSVSRLDRARVLMEVGLVDDADELLTQAAGVMRAAHMSEELADVLLEQARCALLRGRNTDAVSMVGEMLATGEHGGHHRDLEAKAIRLEALAALAPLADSALESEAAALVRAAEALGRQQIADRATALWVILSNRGRRAVVGAEADRRLRRMRSSPHLATRALAIRAQFSLAATRATRERLARAAAADVAAARAGMLSLDLRTALAIHIAPVIELDVAHAVAGGNAWLALAASERWRTALGGVVSVSPPADPAVAALWSTLRQLHEEQRDAAPEEAGRLGSEAGRIEHQLRERSWTAGKKGVMAGRPLPTREEFGRATVLSYLWMAERVFVVVVAPGRKVELVHVAQRRAAAEMLARATADAGAAARVPHGPLAASVLSSLEHSLALLEQMMLPPIPEEGPVVIVPGGALAHLPWGMLPRLRKRSVTVSRSVTAWHAGNTLLTDPPTVAVAVGPGLALGQSEADLVISGWVDAHQVPGESAGVAAALTRHDVLHVAAHGEHRADNPLFSSLRLHGGALFAHELERVPLAASLVVLSACSAGRAQLRPGDEALGLTSSLLAMGVSAVVAPLTDVPDDVACATMGEFHRRLAAGEDGPAALAAASRSLLSRSFTWFGSNWKAMRTH
ncbi:MAG: CHAT domain-containing protein [Propionibacteriaceae bacterium]|nr:CHAT domain-containing protein [Propionibacteriaceae bacterium]